MSGFSEEWEDEWSNRTDYPEWPWTDLVSKVHRHTDMRDGDKVLELGCGAGANIQFFLGLNVDYYAIEGSESAVDEVLERFPVPKGNIDIGDFTQDIAFDAKFDYVIDRASLAANSTEGIRNALDLVYKNLVDGGKVITIDMYSDDHSEYQQGTELIDEYTRAGFDGGDFDGLDEIHFCSETHIKELYGDKFEFEMLEHKIRNRKIPDDNYQFAAWNIVGRK